MKIYANADEAKEILVRGKFDDAAKVAAVKEIVRDVQKRKNSTAAFLPPIPCA